jgi:hypothetical protein
VARNIGMDNNETFRAITQYRYRYGSDGKKVQTTIEGPYSKIGAARARVSSLSGRGLTR